MGFDEWDALADMILHHAAPLPQRIFPRQSPRSKSASGFRSLADCD